MTDIGNKDVYDSGFVVIMGFYGSCFLGALVKIYDDTAAITGGTINGRTGKLRSFLS